MADDTVEAAKARLLDAIRAGNVPLHPPIDQLIAAVRAENAHTAQVAHDFVRYYVEGTNGCRNCGGFPHTDTCFVGRFVLSLALDYNARS